MTIDFKDITEEEQKAWWLKKARATLEQFFGINDAEIQWLSYTHNVVFDVTLDDHHWILHLYSSSNISYERLVALATWLKNLQSETGLKVTSPEWHNGKLQIVKITFQDSEIPAALYPYYEGDERNSDTVDNTAMQSIGEYIAKIHGFSGKLTSKNSVFPTLDYDGLFGENGIYHPGEEALKVFTDEQIEVMDTVAEKVKSAMDELGTGDDEFGLIHGDLLLKNILFHDGDVRALDFEYCGWGYYVYDLTPILWQLKPQDRYPALEQALWDGYTSVRHLSVRHRELLETFIAARQVASMRWVAANRHNPAYVGKVEGIMQQRTAELQGFLETGKLERV